MDKLAITARLKTPLIIGGGHMTFDALLAALLFERTGDVEKAHNEIPLRCTNDVWHGSAAIVEPFSSSKVSFVANLRPTHSLDPDLLRQVDVKDDGGQVIGKRLHRKISLTRRRDFGAVMNGYRAFDAADVTWFAEGDGEVIERLVSDVHFIGKRRGSGFGEVAGWSVAAGDLDGVIGPFGDPLRPVPVDLFKGDQSAIKLDAAWRPAYWHPKNRAICFAPEFVK
jgi:CRISPR type IV-associated protein Csf3